MTTSVLAPISALDLDTDVHSVVSVSKESLQGLQDLFLEEISEHGASVLFESDSHLFLSLNCAAAQTATGFCLDYILGEMPMIDAN